MDASRCWRGGCAGEEEGMATLTLPPPTTAAKLTAADLAAIPFFSFSKRVLSFPSLALALFLTAWHQQTKAEALFACRREKETNREKKDKDNNRSIV